MFICFILTSPQKITAQEIWTKFRQTKPFNFDTRRHQYTTPMLIAARKSELVKLKSTQISILISGYHFRNKASALLQFLLSMDPFVQLDNTTIPEYLIGTQPTRSFYEIIWKTIAIAITTNTASGHLITLLCISISDRADILGNVGRRRSSPM